MLKKYFISLVCLSGLAIFSNLEAGLEKYFKKIKADDQKTCRSIRNIDFIYMVNLDGRPEKYNRSRKMLQKYGITAYRFSAVNGWDLNIWVTYRFSA